MLTPRGSLADARVVNLGGPADLVLTRIDGPSVWLWAFPECQPRRATGDSTPLGLRRHLVNYPLVSDPVEKPGFRCREDGVYVTAATSDDGVTWWATGLTLLWDPETATLNPRPSYGGMGLVAAAVPLHSPEDDALTQSYADFDCSGAASDGRPARPPGTP